jgi:hypothetical protein
MRLNESGLRKMSSWGRSYASIIEAQDAPRWRFGYSGQDVHDTKPDILVLGSYTHPSTGNDLVGGININYLTNIELKTLMKQLPSFIDAADLYDRYHAGKELLPDIFDKAYRTYDADLIQSPKPGQLFALPQHAQTPEQAAQPMQREPEDMPQAAKQRIPAHDLPPVPPAPTVRKAPETPRTPLATAPKPETRPASRGQGKRPETPAVAPPQTSYQPDLQAMQDIVSANADYNSQDFTYDQPPQPAQPAQSPVAQPPQPAAPPARTRAARQPAQPLPEPPSLDLEPSMAESIRYFDPGLGRYVVESFDIHKLG